MPPFGFNIRKVMKRFAISILFLGFVLLFSGCVIERGVISGSEQLSRQDFPLTGFQRISLSSLFQVEVFLSDTYRVEVECNDNVLDLLDVVKRDETLVLAVKPGYQFKEVTLKAVVYLPMLIGIDASGASRVQLHDIRAPRFSGSLSGVSKMEGILWVDKEMQVEASGASVVLLGCKAETAKLSFSGTSKWAGKLDVEDALEVEASGASLVALQGRAATGRISLSGASKFSGSEFLFVRSAEVDASGAGSITLCTNGLLEAELSGASALYYYGNAEVVKRQISGASSVKRSGEMPLL